VSRPSLLVPAVVVLLLATAALESQQVLITEDGMAKSIIVYPREPSERVATAIE
jgi:hypothetical protein